MLDRSQDMSPMLFQDCPSADLLKSFSLGDLSKDGLQSVADHVSSCEKCDQQLRQFDGQCDDFLKSLRDFAPPTLGSRESTAGIGGENNSGFDAAQMMLDPGRSYSIRLAQGEVTLGRFILQAELGAGSFGYVFLARDTELDRQVAIKIQRAGRYADTEEVQRFIREAKNAARLKHSSIVSLYETGQTEDGVCYLVTEFVDGQTLQQIMQLGAIPIGQTTEYLRELCEALDYAHQHDVVHRDVKPSNIIIDGRGKIHLMDFGLAKRIAADDTVTHDGKVMGTPAYMSPEQARGQSQEVDARSDVYSLGVVMYEMLTGQQPFQGKKRLLLLQVLEDDPRPPSQLNDRIPRDLEVICLKAMSKPPRSRYQSAAEMGGDLQRYLRGEPILARPVSHAERFARWCRRYPAAVAAFLTLLTGSVLAILYLSQLSQYFVRQTARDSAQMQSEMLDSINEYYASIVKQMDIYLQENRGSMSQAELETMLHSQSDPIVPVPARFTIELGKILQSSKSVQVRLYSDYPFPQREDGGPQDEFGHRALKKLSADPTTPVVEFTDLNGQSVVRFATARVMTESCVDCHNAHKDSPKRDWKVDDVRGVLEVIRPLERDQLRARRGMGSAISWILGSIFLLTFFVSAVLLVTTRKRTE